MGKGYWRMCYNMKKNVVAKIIETLGDKVLDIEEQDMVVVVIERHCGESVEGRIVHIFKYGFTLHFDSDYEYSWMEMRLEDLCCLLDYLLAYEN